MPTNEGKDVFGVEPLPKPDGGPSKDEAASGSGAAPGGPGAASAGAPQSGGRISSPGLIDEFDEDADFDRDPERDAVLRARAGDGGAPKTPERARWTGDFSAPTLGSARVVGVSGAVVLAFAAVAAGVTAPNYALRRVILVFYDAALQTGAGLVAVVLAAVVCGQRVGRYDLALARMFLAVSAFLLVYNLNIPIPTRLDEAALAAGAYALVTWALFRLDSTRLAILCGLHFLMFLVVVLGAVLRTGLEAAPVPVASP